MYSVPCSSCCLEKNPAVVIQVKKGGGVVFKEHFTDIGMQYCMDVYGLLVIKQYLGSTSIFAPLKKGEGRDDLLPPPPLSAVPTVIPIIIITVIGVPVKKNRGGHIFARRILKFPDGSKMNQNIV